MDKPSKKRNRISGFTLIEILIVMAIMGVLATMVIAIIKNVSDGARRTAFQLNGKRFVEAATRYHLDYGEYPEDSALGVLPFDFEFYIQAEKWVQVTPIGGLWDCQLYSDGITSAIGVDFNGASTVRDDAYMQEVDAIVDDGNLATGYFQKLGAGRFYFIIKG